MEILDGDQVLFVLNNQKNAVPLSLSSFFPLSFWIHFGVFKIVDESDAFFGVGNNGRDCIRKSDDYDYDLLYFSSPSYLPSSPPFLRPSIPPPPRLRPPLRVYRSCFYQNNQKAYTADQYLTGVVSTSGIARSVISSLLHILLSFDYLKIVYLCFN